MDHYKAGDIMLKSNYDVSIFRILGAAKQFMIDIIKG